MTAYYNEFDHKAAAWLREIIKRGLIADGEVDDRSILDVSPDELRGFTQCHFFAGIGGWSYALRIAGWPDDRPVWTGSPPCQPFSAAGKGLGRDDARHLGPHFVSLVRACRPAVLFGEQVASAAVFGKAASGAGKASARAPEWTWLDDLCDRLEAARYAVGASDIPAAGVGAPHIRQRTFFGAVRLADADGCGQSGQRIVGRSCHTEAGADREVNRAVNDGWGGRMADANFAIEGVVRSGSDFVGEGRTRNTWIGHRGCGRYGGLADTDGGQRGRVADGEGRLGHGAATGRLKGDGEPERGGKDSRTNAPHSPWANPDWLFCRDGKWRPVESGTFPLADGLPARVGRLRGYGNAIVPQAAAAFVTAFKDAMADQWGWHAQQQEAANG